MSEIIKLTRRQEDEVVNEETGEVVGKIKDGAIIFTQTIEGRIEYDLELSRFIEKEGMRKDDKYITGTIEANYDNYLSTDEEIRDREGEQIHEEHEH